VIIFQLLKSSHWWVQILPLRLYDFVIDIYGKSGEPKLNNKDSSLEADNQMEVEDVRFVKKI
jgi:hypothetical protein